MQKPAVAIAIISLLFLISTPTIHAGTQIISNVTYCSPGGVQLQMDLYLPTTTGPYPIVVDVHGGAWVSGSKSDEWATGLYPLLNVEGIAMASINYRLAPQYPFPAQIEDVACAVRFLRANAALYNINPAEIGGFGDSAGGHLVLLLGFTNGATNWPNDGEWTGYSSSINAIVDWFGPTNLSQSSDFQSKVNIDITETFGTSQSALTAGSPMTYVSSSAPPTLIMHGQKDGVVKIIQSEELYSALEADGTTAQFTEVANVGHSWVHVGWPWQPITPSVAQINQDTANWFGTYI